MENENIQELKFQVGEAWKGVYSSSTAYGLANVVQDPTGLSIYRSLKSGNVGHPVTDSAWWFRIIDMSSIKAESDRIAAINQAIAQDEALRVAAEELRQQHEAARIAAETQRNQAEQARISAEQQRVTKETQRETAEQNRITAEQGRVSAESARVQAEQARVLAETLRANAEDQRAANEQNRIAAEQQRIERAEQDHDRAESDHAALQVYFDSLGAFDISSYHATDGVLAKYADLAAALGTNGANIPEDIRKGGMSVKFVQSSDNKYVQFRCMANAFTTDVTQWQGVDDEPTAGSGSLVKSGGVESSIEHTALEITGAIDDNWFVTGNVPYYRVSDGAALTNSDRKRTILFKVSEGDTFEYRISNSTTIYAIAAFDDSKNLIAAKSVAGNNGWLNGTYTVEQGVAYLQFCIVPTSASTVKKTNAKYDKTAQIKDLQEHALLDGYYKCETEGDNPNKRIDIAGFKLLTGGCLKVKFEHAHTSSNAVNLSINGTILKPIIYEGAAVTLNHTWEDGEVVEFYYDDTDGGKFYGTKFGGNSNLLSANIGYYICQYGDTAQTKVISGAKFNDLLVGGCFKVKFTYANTSDDVNLKVGSGDNTYIKPLFYNGSRVSSTNSWKAEEVVEIYYDGTNFNAFPVDLHKEIEEVKSLMNRAGNIFSNTKSATSGTTLIVDVAVDIPAGHIVRINDNQENKVSSVDIYVKYRGSDSFTYISGYPINQRNPIDLSFSQDVIVVRYDISASVQTYSGNVTVTAEELGEIQSELSKNTEGIIKQKLIVSSESTGLAQNTAIKLSIPAGKKFILKVVDPNNALSGHDVKIYNIRSESEANRLATIKPNSLSDILVAESSIDWCYFVARASGTADWGDGTVSFEVHIESEQSDTIFNKLYSMEHGSIKTGGSCIVEIENPYWSVSWAGSGITVLDPSVNGIYVKFDNIIIYDGKKRVIKTWNDVLTDTNKTGSTSSEAVSNCLWLGDYETYNQVLAYNLEEEKFVIEADTIALPDGKYIYLAYAKDGLWCGPICERYDSVKVNNQSPFLTQIRRSYINTFRDKEVELFDVKDKFVFGFCSDVHYAIHETGSELINVTNVIMSDIDNFIGLDAILNGGDNILYGTKFKRHGLVATLREFKDINLDKFIPCPGNHDYNGVGDGSTIQEKSWTITDRDLETIYFRNCKTTYRPDGKLYYWRDFDEKKVRIVVLNTQDVPVQFDANDKIVYDPLTLFGISQQQMNFIISSLDFSAKNNPNDWKVIFLMHVGLYSNTEGVVPVSPEFPDGYDRSKGMYSNGDIINKEILRNIFKAFVNRTSYSYSYTDSEHDGIFTVSGSVDFTSANGKLVAVLNGHTHRDQYINRDGFNCIGIQSSYPTAEHDDDSLAALPSMPPATYNEFCIDVFILDDAQQKIIIKRFGKYQEFYNPTGDREYSYDVTI